MPISHEDRLIERIYNPTDNDIQKIKRAYSIGVVDNTVRPILVYSNYDITYDYGSEAGAEVDGDLLKDGLWGKSEVLPTSYFVDEIHGKLHPEEDNKIKQDTWYIKITDGSDNYDDGLVVDGDSIEVTDANNFRDYSLYSNLKRDCISNLTNTKEIYLGDAEGYSSVEESIEASKRAVEEKISDRYNDFVNDEYKHTRGGSILMIAQPNLVYASGE